MHFNQYNRLLSQEFVFHCPILTEPQDTAGVHMVLYCTAKQAMLGNALKTCRGGRKMSKATQLGFHFSLDAMFQQESHTHSPEQAQKLSCSQFSAPTCTGSATQSCEKPAQELLQNVPMPSSSSTAIPRLTSVLQAATLNIKGKCIGSTENCFPPGLLVKCLIEEEDKRFSRHVLPLRMDWYNTEFNVR